MKPMAQVLICAFLATAGAMGANAKGRQYTGEELYRMTGGMIIKRGTFTGKVSVVDMQSQVPHTEIKRAAKILADATECNVVCTRSKQTNVTEWLSGSDAKVGIFVVEDTGKCSFLMAPDEHWGVVPVAKSDDAAVRASRTRKQIIRAFCYLCGGVGSQFKNAPMNSASQKDLDTSDEVLPIDLVDRCRRHLENLGVTPKQYTAYIDACYEGWAPPPTNEIQRAIWEDVRKPPEKPLKITYDKDKQKPVVK